MNDQLEKYIKDHRDEFDDVNPPKDLWQNIENEISSPKIDRHRAQTSIYWKAAAVVLLLVSTWLAFDKVYMSQVKVPVAGQAVLSPELNEAEQYYIALIEQKRQEIKAFSKENKLGESFLYEIEKLDSMYGILKKEMPQGNQDEIADAMILNLQLRIEVLNQQLNIIQSIENSREDEKSVL
ncbi:MAG: hypothetical protein HC819_16375 [Cyclobacteriaceae bacterium]|nr:hypothetical protein [Cyclobacteriaceae bacterium]